MTSRDGSLTDPGVGHNGQIRILLVDDDGEFAEVTQRFLERERDPFSVTKVTSAEEALDIFEEGTFDCIVSDYEMPGMDGLELFEELGSPTLDIPFILFTGKGSETVASRAISQGVTDYLQKAGSADQFAVLANRVENAVDRRRSQRALKRSQRRLSLFFHQSPLGIMEFDADLQFVRANSTTQRILGYTDEELRGRSWLDFVPADHGDNSDAALGDLLATEGSHYTVAETATADGERLICEWHSRVVTDGDGNALTVFTQFQDVTERVEATRRLETLMSNLPGMVYRCENDPGWPMTFVGGECEQLCGYTAAELEDGEVVWGEEILHPDDRERAWNAVQSALGDDEPFELTYRIRDREGETRWVWERGRGVYDADGDVLALEGFITDITERTERERELARFERAVEAAGNSIYMTEPDGTITYANPAFEETTGYDREEVIGQTPKLLDSGEHSEAYFQSLWETITAGERWENEITDQRKDGGLYTAYQIVTPVTDADGEIDRFVAVQTDITERKRREEAIEALHGATRELMAAESEDAIAETVAETAVELLGLPYTSIHFSEDDSLVPVAWSSPVDADNGTPPAFDRNSPAWSVYESGESRIYADLAAEEHVHSPGPVFESEMIVPVGEHGVVLSASTEPDGYDADDRRLVELLCANAATALDRVERATSLRERERELQRENERLDRFVSLASHDLRNPLDAAQLRLDLARRECDSDHLDVVERSHNRIETLLSDLLSMARTGESVSDVDEVELGDLARRCRSQLDKGDATVEVEADARILADESRLGQLLENLYRNSVEHGSMDSRPQADDAIEHGASDGTDVTIRVGTLAEGFYVEDDGPGIPPDQREEVFEAGYSTERESTGFGLSIVREIVRAHDWSIAIAEGQSGGARFEITGVETPE